MTNAAHILFDWGTGSETRKTDDAMAAPFGDVPASPGNAATAEAIAAIEGIRKTGKRGRKSREEIEAEARRKQEEFAAEFATLFDPEQWAGICRSPADLMLHLTKRPLWDVTDREIKPMATGAANSARLFLRTDPKWVALAMFFISTAQIYGTRIAMNLNQAAKERAERERKPS